MAQPIQVPQTVPNAPQFQVPTDLVNAYLARKQQSNQDTLNRVQELGSTVHNYQQQKIQNQLAALGAVSQLYGAGGPRAVQSYAPQLNQMGGGQVTPPAPASAPQAQTTPPPTPTAGVAQDQTQSPYIQASLAQGHPDVAGVGGFHAPQPSPSDLADIQSGGTYGRNKAQSFKDLGDISMQPLTAQEKGASIRAQNAKFATPEQGAAIASGDPAAVAGAYGGQAPIEAYNNAAQKQMEVKKTVAGEISKQGQSSEQIGQIRQLYTDLQGALEKNQPSIGGNLSGKVNQISGGRIGSESAANVLNASNPLATALNTELSRRFNSGEVQLLSNSLIPQPMDTATMRQNKMARLGNMISAMESGNEQNVKNVANAITGGKINTTIMPIKSKPIGTSSTPKMNIPTISSDADFNALPKGAKFQDPSGQVHTKK